jgi:hypothetical protein
VFTELLLTDGGSTGRNGSPVASKSGSQRKSRIFGEYYGTVTSTFVVTNSPVLLSPAVTVY